MSIRLSYAITTATLLACMHCSSGPACGPGTVEKEGQCVPTGDSNDNPADAGANNDVPDVGRDGGPDLTCDPGVCPPLLNAEAACDAGMCVYACRDGYDDCDGTLENGCEADLVAPETCGSCGNACPRVPATVAVCSDGQCGVTCEPGRADCDGSLLSGCESNLSSVWTCGDCTTRCGSRQLCWNGECEDVPPSWAYELDGEDVEPWDTAALEDGAVVVGRFAGQLDLDVEVFNDANDNFIVGLDGNGAPTWAHQIFTANAFGLEVKRVRVHGDTVYLVGWADGETLFGSANTAIATPNGDRDAFIATIHTDGTWGWARTYGTSGSSEAAQDIAVTSSGDLVVGFSYQGPTDIGLETLPADSDTYRAGVIVRMQGNGLPIAQQPLSPDNALSDPLISLAVTDADDVIVGFENNSDALTVAGQSVMGYGAVLARLDAGLNVVWLRGLSPNMQSLTSLVATNARIYTVTSFAPPYDVGTDLVSMSLDGVDTWSQKIPHRAFLGPVVDSSDRVFAASRVTRDGAGTSALLLGHNGSGVPIWSTDVAAASGDIDIAFLSISPSDRLLVVGSSSDAVTLANTPIGAGRVFLLSFPPLP